jgi:hypothetical protein
MKKQINRTWRDFEDCERQTRAIIGEPSDEKSRHFVLMPKYESLFALPGGATVDAATLKKAAKKAKLPFKIDENYPVIRRGHD